jgi:hypothetical protein
MDPDQPAHPRSLIRIHAVRLPTLLQVKKLKANNMDVYGQKLPGLHIDNCLSLKTHYKVCF